MTRLFLKAASSESVSYKNSLLTISLVNFLTSLVTKLLLRIFFMVQTIMNGPLDATI